MVRREAWYFKEVGTKNTPACLELLEKAAAEGFQHLVVASTTGDSGVQAARRLSGKNVNLVVVGHSVGFKGPNIDEFLPEHHDEIIRLGGKVLKATILTHSLDDKYGGAIQGHRPYPPHGQFPEAPWPGHQGLLRNRHGGGGHGAHPGGSRSGGRRRHCPGLGHGGRP